MSFGERDALDRDWPEWAHAGQVPPERCADGSDWRTWVIMAGRGFGKTRAGAEWITNAVREVVGMGTGRGTPNRGVPGDVPMRIALVGATIDEARRVMVEGQSGLLAVAEPWIAAWIPSRLLLRFKGGAQAMLFSGASPEALRGPEHHLAWCDELAKWEKPQETWDMLQLGLRLGDWPRAIVTTTPRGGAELERIMASPGCVTTGGPTQANPHLPQAFVENVEALYAGTRLGAQEIEGKLLTGVPGALWTVEMLERCRGLPARQEGVDDGSASYPSTIPSAGNGSPPHRLAMGRNFARVVIGVDPPAGDGTCGIVACARDDEGIAHILADHSVTALSPEAWARAVADAARIHGGTEGSARVVAERNQGGAMVRTVLHGADPRLRVKLVTASVGKSFRAEPVSRLFEAGKAVLHGRFPELEAELLGMIAGGGYDGPGISPDRADAMVWALTELMLGAEPAEPRIRTL